MDVSELPFSLDFFNSLSRIDNYKIFPTNKIKDLYFKYSDKSPNILDGIDIYLKKGDHLGIIGKSGCGKSTLIDIFMGLIPPDKGKVFIDGKNIMEASKQDIIGFRWKQISIVMQSALNALNPVLSVREQIFDVLNTHKGLIGKEADDRTQELLSLVDIDITHLDSYPHNQHSLI